jgi:UDP-glucose 4-epimerase
MTRRRVVITGAAGAVGTALLHKLAAGDAGYDLHAIACRPPPSSVYPLAKWHQVDLADPRAVTRLQRLFAKARCVVHLAWPPQATRESRDLDAVGVGGSTAVLIGAHVADVNQLVYLSSAASYAPAPGKRVDESWPTAGIPTCAFSRAKSAVEALLDDYDRKGDGMPITRLRPGLIVGRRAARGVRRAAFPPYFPPRLLNLLPLLPVETAVQVPVIHADDVADACLSAIERRVFGAFNLAAEPPLRPHDIAHAFGALPMRIPAQLMRPLVVASWRARLQPIDPGWLDVITSMPLLDTRRARVELQWEPRHTSLQAVADLAETLTARTGTGSPALTGASLVGGIRRRFSGDV